MPTVGRSQDFRQPPAQCRGQLGDTTPSDRPCTAISGWPQEKQWCSRGQPGSRRLPSKWPRSGGGASGGWTGDRETGCPAGPHRGQRLRDTWRAGAGRGLGSWGQLDGQVRAGMAPAYFHSTCPSLHLAQTTPKQGLSPQETSPCPSQGLLMSQPPARGPRWGALWPRPVRGYRVWGPASGTSPLSPAPGQGLT